MATTRIAMAPMKAVQISKPGAEVEIVEREIPNPGAGEVRIKLQDCGRCHSEVLTKEGLWPGIQYPRVPEHEVAGIIDELGPKCCRLEDCTARWQFPEPENSGISYDGGYEQYMVAPIEAPVPIPETLVDTEAAPLLCARLLSGNGQFASF